MRGLALPEAWGSAYERRLSRERVAVPGPPATQLDPEEGGGGSNYSCSTQTLTDDYDQVWLDYQHEIGKRHHRTGKNRVDGAEAAPHIHYRYLPALLYPVTATLKPFLAKGRHSEEEVEKMHQAWIKSVLLQVILWSEPYVKEGDF